VLKLSSRDTLLRSNLSAWRLVMADENYVFEVKADDSATASRAAVSLADALREADGVLKAVRSKADDETMELGTIVSIVAASGSTLAVARGIATWLTGRRGVSLRVKKTPKTGELIVELKGIDPAAAVRIMEIVERE
jgi:hypothetical protein